MSQTLIAEGTTAEVPAHEPEDAGLDRRAFLARFGALSAAAAASAALAPFWPKPAAARCAGRP